ncbi:MAG TPA: hypothetical protein VIY73_23325 [Polyangiaceae bacterium]
MARAKGAIGIAGLAVTAALGLLGCPRVKPVESDAGAAGGGSAVSAPSAVPQEPAQIAANDFEITRYPDERPMNHVLGATRVAASDARTQASASLGAVVERLPPGTPVDEIAERPGWKLVVFVDPKDRTESRRVLGWLPDADFGAPSVRRADGGPVPVPTPLPAPLPGPTGSLTAVPTTSPTAVPTTPHPTRALDVKQEHGACAGGYAPCGAMCRLRCGSEADCGGAAARCAGGFCLAPGAQPCAR